MKEKIRNSIEKNKKKKEKISPNEESISFRNKNISQWVKVIKPSRPNLVYDRME